MTYSLDLKKCVISFIHNGGTKTQAAKIFGINRDTVYAWLKEPTDTVKKVFTRKRKLDRDKLLEHVREKPDALLRERASHFGVSINAIHFALKKMKIVKKNSDGIKKKILWKELSS